MISKVERTRHAGEVRYAFIDLEGSGNRLAGYRQTPEATEPQLTSSAAGRIGLQIRARRREEDLTQTQLAARAGITQTVLSRVESGKGNSTLTLLEEIAAALGTELNVNLSD